MSDELDSANRRARAAEQENERLRNENNRLQGMLTIRTERYVELVKQFDKLTGTPCEQVRHQQEIEELRGIMSDMLSFCDGPLGCLYSSQEPVRRARAALAKNPSTPPAVTPATPALANPDTEPAGGTTTCPPTGHTIPEGWKLVPEYSTHAMRAAFLRMQGAIRNSSVETTPERAFQSKYEAMLAAAPEPPQLHAIDNSRPMTAKEIREEISNSPEHRFVPGVPRATYNFYAVAPCSPTTEASVRDTGASGAPGDGTHVAWLRYNDHNGRSATTIHLCDSDTPGAFKVYRRPEVEAAEAPCRNCGETEKPDMCSGGPWCKFPRNSSPAQGGTTERPFAHDPANPGINKGNEGPRF